VIAEVTLNSVQKSGVQHTHQCVIQNHSDQPIQILSAQLSCSCLSVSTLPQIIMPRNSIEFSVWVDVQADYRDYFQTGRSVHRSIRTGHCDASG